MYTGCAENRDGGANRGVGETSYCNNVCTIEPSLFVVVGVPGRLFDAAALR